MGHSFDHKTKASDLVSLWADHIAGKTVLVTGVSPGSLGAFFVQRISVANPSTLILAGRNPDIFQSVIDEVHASQPDITIKPLTLDLTSLASVRAAATTFNSWADVPHVDVIVCNAGIMATPFSLTEDGFERQFQANHLGHFLLVNLLMHKLLAAHSPRVVSVSSDNHRFGGIRWSDPNFAGGPGKYYDRFLAYAQAKTANCLFAIALAERLGRTRGLRAYSLHPGVVQTNLASHVGDLRTYLGEVEELDARLGTRMVDGVPEDEVVKDADEGVATHVFASFNPDLDAEEWNGAYLVNCRLADPYEEEIHAWASSRVDADRLWKMSEKMVDQVFEYLD